MNKTELQQEIEQEIEDLRLRLRELEINLAAASNFGDNQVRYHINKAAETYRNKLIEEGGLEDISEHFGEVVAFGEYKNRGLHLSDKYDIRDWEWDVVFDMLFKIEVLVRVDKETRRIID